tara:strand:+ start:1242 stop:3686 length:2445 start_codon:yes stop_codon:yes gene_type:complete
MFVSINWIREHITIPDNISVDEIVDKLTKASVEVDGVKTIGDWWDPTLMQVGLVNNILPHPNADRLRLADIQLSNNEIERVVCGAPNLEIGQKIIFAKTGSKVFSPKDNKFFVLETASIRGIESNGMVLSESEMGISDSHEGILVLDKNVKIGTPAKDILSDVILDVHIWPNRPDLMNIVGIAREIDAIFNSVSTLILPDIKFDIHENMDISFPNIIIDTKDLCPRYIGILLKDVSIGESPQWLKDKLLSTGLRPIYNVVDITNYVMMELGQPLHAFDFNSLEGSIIVRNAKKGEILKTLDGIDRKLSPDDLVIADDNAVIALAGVMGGANSQITDATHNVFLEAANFHPNSIRKTSQKFDLRSESSARFERNLPPYLAVIAAQRAAKLIQDICGGTIIHELVDVHGQLDVNPQLVEMDIQYVKKICGMNVSEDEVLQKLELLGFSLHSKANGLLVIEIPLWRTDIHIVDDLIEEFIRIYGYDSVPSIPLSGSIPMHPQQKIVGIRDKIKDMFVNKGFHEIITYSLTTIDKLTAALGESAVSSNKPVSLKNTLSSERSVLRTTLKHSLLETISYNLKNGQQDLWFFEAGRAYATKNDLYEGIYPTSPLAEDEFIVGAISAKVKDRFDMNTNKNIGFFEAKGILESIFNNLELQESYHDANVYGFSNELVDIRIKDVIVGHLGALNASVLHQFDINESVILFEINLGLLSKVLANHQPFVQFSKFPPVVNDIAVVLDVNVLHIDIHNVLIESPLVVSAQLFDIYSGDQLGPNKKSLAYKLTFQSFEKTLTNEEVNIEQSKIIKTLINKFDATIRE